MLIINAPAVVDLASNDETVGALAGSGTIAFPVEAIKHTFTVGGTNASTDFAGSFVDNPPGAPGSPRADVLAKTGGGTLTLSGISTFAGDYDVQAGTLIV